MKKNIIIDHDGDYFNLDEIFSISNVIQDNNKCSIVFITNNGNEFLHEFFYNHYKDTPEQLIQKIKNIKNDIVNRWITGSDEKELIFKPYNVLSIKKDKIETIDLVE